MMMTDGVLLIKEKNKFIFSKHGPFPQIHYNFFFFERGTSLVFFDSTTNNGSRRGFK